ncbi:hypothetical protein CAEBREN_23931 [Caenorhabditis brenneri]|uniref:N-acetyltransferase domain-containing protein n=1 Tax=Caenorhabditis brenneri TaxID=135651 RepID=G0NHS7_CAEBE|nr:hypothetical protein CAEBREN_23931 [Caenorhabditis brenneri]
MTEFETIVNPPQEVFEQIVKLTGETEDWSFHLDDYKYYLSSYDQFWLVAVVEKGTLNIAATVSLARWDGEDGPLFSIGMYYVVPRYRGTGLGKPIFQKVMDIVGDNNCTLTGEVKMSEKYAKEFGFDKCPPHWLLYSTLQTTDCVVPEYVSAKYTTKVVLDQAGNIVGYGIIRLVTLNKLNIAPFYADNVEAAEVLLKDLLEMVPNWQTYSSFSFLYPECNKDPLTLLEKFAKSKEFVSTCVLLRSQFTKKLIPSSDHKVYAIVDCAFQYV